MHSQATRKKMARSAVPACKYKYVETPSPSLQCSLCKETAQEPWQHGNGECAALFCLRCLELYGREKECYVCKGEQPLYFVDGKSHKEIQALAVRCENVGRGCEWVGTVAAFQEHVDACRFALLPCPNLCEFQENKVRHFPMKDLDNHLERECPNRDVTCEHCGVKGMYASMVYVHGKTCSEKILPCPNDGCGEKMEGQFIEKHVTSECEHTVLPCKYAIIGCKLELKRKDMAAHEQDGSVHLDVAMNTLSILRERNATLTDGEPVKFKLTGYETRKSGNEYVDSPSYYVSPNGYHMALRVYANGYGDGLGTHLSVYAVILRGRYDAKLKWPFVGKVTFTLLNQKADKNHHQHSLNLIAKWNVQVGIASDNHQFIPHSKLGRDPVRNTEYLVEDTLYFRMEVEVADTRHWLE